MDTDDDVEIIQLQEGTVRIVLPSPTLQRRRDGRNGDELNFTQPTAVSSSQISTLKPTTQNKFVPSSGKETENEEVSRPTTLITRETISDRNGGYKAIAGTDISQSNRTSVLELKASKIQNKEKSESYTEIPLPKMPRNIVSDTNSSLSLTCPAEREKASDSFSICSQDRTPPGLMFAKVEQLEQNGTGLDDKKQTITSQPAFVTTLPTGATRIFVKQSLLQLKRERGDLHTLDSENIKMDDDSKHSLESLSSEGDKGILFSKLTFDCLEDVEVSSENEDQLAHILISVDSSENESDSQQQFGKHSNNKYSSSCDKICPTTSSAGLILDLQTNRNLHMKKETSGHSPCTSDPVKKFSEDINPPYHESTSKHEWFVPCANDRERSTRDLMWMDFKISPTPSEDTEKPHGVTIEEHSGSEWLSSGQTFSRAMWRSMSADTSQVSPPFSSRVPLHMAFSGLQHEYTGPSSSDEEYMQRPKSASFFSRLRWKSKVLRKWKGNKRTQRKSLTGKSHSSVIDNNKSLTGKSHSSVIDNNKKEKQARKGSGTEHEYAERYLDAALAFAESKRTKSSLKHSAGRVRDKELKFIPVNKHKHLHKKTAATDGNQHSSSVLFSKPSPTTSSQGARSDFHAAEFKQSPSAEKKPPLKADATKTAAANALSVVITTSSPADSLQSSSQLTSSDSHRSTCLTSEEKGESETSTSSADSVHTVYFVPKKVVSFNSTDVTHVAKKAKARHKASQYSAPGSRSDSLQSSDSTVSKLEERHNKKGHLRQTDTEQPGLLAQDDTTDKSHLHRKHVIVNGRARDRNTVDLRTCFMDNTYKIEGSFKGTTDTVKSSEKENSSTRDPDKEKSEPTDIDTTANADYLTQQVSANAKLGPATETTASEPLVRTSSFSTSSENQSVGGYRQDSDTGNKTSLSRSSSNCLLTSESEIGPLVTFPRPRKTWGVAAGQSTGAESEAEAEQDNVTAVELRRRYSADEYVPASPFASHLRRHPSNLSDGARPLFLQTQRSHSRQSHVRQLSMDIGEEWESVHSPTLSRPPVSPTSLLAEEDDVFFGPSTSFNSRTSSLRQEYIPLEERMSYRASRQLPSVRKKSHQTSAKLRLLYPNPADPRCASMTEEEKRELMSILTPAELSRLQQAESPLLELLKAPEKGRPHQIKTLKQEQADDSSPEPTTAVEHAQMGMPLIQIDSKSRKPVVTVQPMPQVSNEQALCSGPSDSSRDAIITMPSTNVQFDHLDSLPAFQRRLLPNPFNRLNQRCHSALQCPCCFFFCFLCCIPALVFMSRSDYEFDYGSVEKARRYGRRTTVLYVIGSVVAVCVLVASIVATVIYLQELLLQRRGWS